MQVSLHNMQHALTTGFLCCMIFNLGSVPALKGLGPRYIQLWYAVKSVLGQYITETTSFSAFSFLPLIEDKKLKTGYKRSVAKPKENLHPAFVKEAQALIAITPLSVDFKGSNENMVRGVYNHQSQHRLDVVKRLFKVVSSVGSKKGGPEFLVGLYPHENDKLRTETHLKERF